jgi:hypothetical protein
VKNTEGCHWLLNPKVSNIAHEARRMVDRPDQRRSLSAAGPRDAPAMDQRSTRRAKVTVFIAGTVVAVLLWGFGIEYVLHADAFVSPPGKFDPDDQVSLIHFRFVRGG